MTTLRDRYAEALLRRVEEHSGPIADLAPMLERLDVLAGVNLEQKQLTGGTPQNEVGTPAIEHGSVDQRGTSVHAQAAPDNEADAALPVVHEVPQQVEAPAFDAPAPVLHATPAAASPEPVPAESYGSPSTPKLRNHRDNRIVWVTCGCGCGERFEKRAYEVDPNRKLFKSREHYQSYTKSSAGRAAAAAAQKAPVTSNGGTNANHVTRVGERPDGDRHDGAPADQGQGRDAAVHEDRAVIACSCPAWWREKTAKFSEGVANEGHHEDCPLYRKGAHRWPLPSAMGDEKGPFTIQCMWCPETRLVDGSGVPWLESMTPVGPSHLANQGNRRTMTPEDEQRRVEAHS